MDDLPQSVILTAVGDDKRHKGLVVPLTRELAKKGIDSRWWVLPEVSATLRKQENDHDWLWAKRIGELRNDRWHEAVAVQSDDREIQGAILYRLDAKSFSDSTKPAVNVEALATAPRNRPWLVKQPLYRGVGEGLLFRAVCHSYLLGFGGCITLFSFDDKKTLEFYQNRGFKVIGRDDELPMLELATNAAEEWLREEGYEI